MNVYILLTNSLDGVYIYQNNFGGNNVIVNANAEAENNKLSQSLKTLLMIQ